MTDSWWKVSVQCATSSLDQSSPHPDAVRMDSKKETVGLAAAISIRIEIAVGSAAAVEMADDIRRLRESLGECQEPPTAAGSRVAIYTG